MLVRNFNLKDIKEYEDNTGANILNFFNDISFTNLIELVKLGNGKCDDELAYEILDNYLKEDGNTLLSGLLEIKEKLLGYGSNNEIDENSEDTVDITKYNSLTELYMHFSMQLMSVGLSYSEFWSMNTEEMYSVFNSICVKMQNETNRELSNYHTLAAMIGGAVWGKLQKEPPKVNLTQNQEEDNSLLIVNELSKIINNKKGE